jgi:hypothetical protein
MYESVFTTNETIERSSSPIGREDRHSTREGLYHGYSVGLETCGVQI